jgi:hypothetical protein
MHDIPVVIKTSSPEMFSLNDFKVKSVKDGEETQRESQKEDW